MASLFWEFCYVKFNICQIYPGNDKKGAAKSLTGGNTYGTFR